MAKGSKVQKPKRRAVRVAKAPRKAKKGRPGDRAVFKRRVTTYDVTLEERKELAAFAKACGKSTSEILAEAVRMLLRGSRLTREVEATPSAPAVPVEPPHPDGFGGTDFPEGPAPQAPAPPAPVEGPADPV